MIEGLNAARSEIEAIDKEIAALFERRMKAVETIGDYKREHSLPIEDTDREKALFKKNLEYIKDEKYKPYYLDYMHNMMDISKQYQRKRQESQKIAYSGVEGAYAYMAASQMYPGATLVGYKDFKSAYKAVERGECDSAVLPLENSFAGEVGQVMDLMFEGPLFVNRIFTLKIEHNLLGIKGATIRDIKKIYSHRQALEQCDSFIRTHDLEAIEDTNTAVAAKKVSEINDISVGAIASLSTARLYNLEIIAENINTDAENTTRFAVFNKIHNMDNVNRDNVHYILMFTVKNEAGALAKAINVIGAYDYNMSFLLSRPMKNLTWQYYFYVELEGNLQTERGKTLINALSVDCDVLKVVGSYQL